MEDSWTPLSSPARTATSTRRDCCWRKARRSIGRRRRSDAAERCENGHVDAARLLLDNGAEVDRTTNMGSTPLSIAKRKGHSSIVALLEAHQK